MADGALVGNEEVLDLTPESRIEIVTPGPLAVRAADVSFQIAENGAVGVSAEQLQQLVGGLASEEVVWFHPAVPEIEPELTDQEDAPQMIHFLDGSLVFNVSAHTVYVEGKSVELAKREYEVLAYLVSNTNRVVGHMEAYENIWGDTIGRESDAGLRVHVGRIRKKLEDYSWVIKSVPGVGYMFSCNEDEELGVQKGADYSRGLEVSKKPPFETEETPSLTSLAGGRLIVDTERREIVVDNARTAPTKRIYDLLEYLVLNKGTVVSSSQIIDAVWGHGVVLQDNCRGAIRRLRDYLGSASPLIRTVREAGYVLDETVFDVSDKDV
jgi:DNA-binding response OmpR family regulator